MRELDRFSRRGLAVSLVFGGFPRSRDGSVNAAAPSVPALLGDGVLDWTTRRAPVRLARVRVRARRAPPRYDVGRPGTTVLCFAVISPLPSRQLRRHLGAAGFAQRRPPLIYSVWFGLVWSVPVCSGLVRSGPVWSGPVMSGPVMSGPVMSGPLCSAPRRIGEGR